MCTHILHFCDSLEAYVKNYAKINTRRYVGYNKSKDPLNPRLHEFDLVCQRKNIIHYLIDPGKPTQNGKVERSHRTDREMFYDRHKFKNVLRLKKELRKWNINYNNLEHCALDELILSEALIKAQNVCS